MGISKQKIRKFFKVYNRYYDLMYDGKCPESGWALGVHFITTDPDTARVLCMEREDPFVSDRELAAYAVAYASTFVTAAPSE